MGQSSEDDAEQPLAGGRLTTGVVRVGESVRRPASPASPFVARLLTHLAEKGFDGCPQYLGSDGLGRDVLSYVPGHVPRRWQRFGDGHIRQAAMLLRRLHDATRDMESIAEGAVVCHHDPGPNNTVFRDGQPVAFIDFDFAAPGHALEDVGYLAWAWCISSRPDRGPATEQARQVRLLADAYGLDAADRDRLPGAVRGRLLRNEAFWRDVLQDEAASISRAHSAEVLAWTQRELAYVDANGEAFVAALQSAQSDASDASVTDDTLDDLPAIVHRATVADIPSWLALAREVEPLFGPMPDLEHAIARGIGRGTALVTGPVGAITGGMLLSRDDRPHRIHWLAVSEVARGRGLGGALVRAALDRWPEGDVDSVTFTDDIPGAKPARRLYERCGMECTGTADPAPDGGTRDRYLLRR